jgi:outer membrane protein assembly factor BamB
VRHRFRLLAMFFAVAVAAVASSSLAASAGGGATTWSQWGLNAQHHSFVDAAGQSLDQILASTVYDPFVAQEQADTGGELLAHYQVPLLRGSDVFMEFKTGTYTPISPDGSNRATHWNSQVWNERALRFRDGRLTVRWNFQSDWKPEPATLVNNWEPVFHAVLVGGSVFVPGLGGTLFQVDAGSGRELARINPFGSIIDPGTFVSGPPAADRRGDIFYNVLKLDANQSAVDSWLVRVAADGTVTRTSYTALVPDPPATCFASFSEATLPWPPSPAAVPPSVPCGIQRAGVNVAPAVAPDGTIYSISRGDSRIAGDSAGFLAAVNPDLTPKWAASLNGHLDDGCGVLVPIAPTDTPVKGDCRHGANVGVDPATNRPPAGRVIDQSSSSPVVLPDGSVLYGSYSRYNVARGHYLKFSPSGTFQASYDFGWDTTPAVFQRDGATHIVIKDNHYDEEGGRYCTPIPGLPVSQVVCAFTGVATGPFFITQLNADLVPEWKFQSTNTQSCSRQPDGSLKCVSDHPGGFEWCVNQPAVDENGVVYMNSEDGNVYTVDQGHRGVFTTPRQTLFLQLALGAAYTPISLNRDGVVFTQNDGVLFAVGADDGHAHAGAAAPPAGAAHHSDGAALQGLPV